MLKGFIEFFWFIWMSNKDVRCRHYDSSIHFLFQCFYLKHSNTHHSLLTLFRRYAQQQFYTWDQQQWKRTTVQKYFCFQSFLHFMIITTCTCLQNKNIKMMPMTCKVCPKWSQCQKLYSLKLYLHFSLSSAARCRKW